MQIEFTAHNIRLDNGSSTKPELGWFMEEHPCFVSAKRILDTVYPGSKKHLRLADIGCLEGGYSFEFARMGFQVLGLDVRQNNIAACHYVKENSNLPNLEFVLDNAWNLGKYGVFDVVFCCGLLYHLDEPKKFLQMLSGLTKKMLILNTHFSTEQPNPKFGLSDMSENESLQGRWYTEFANDQQFKQRENAKWSSWDNYRSFWIKREYLLQTIKDIGFDIVLEQYDFLGNDIVESMTKGFYKTEERGMFIGIKTGDNS
jgi:ubiquinone/menaquinone biosynthesis C-methylase UbiE